MSRSAKIRKPRFTNPEDIKYLSLFGTLISSLKLQEVRISRPGLELKKRKVPDAIMAIRNELGLLEETSGALMISEAKNTTVEIATKKQERSLFPVPAKPLMVSKAQSETLKMVTAAAQETSYEVKALPSSPDMVTIEIMKVSGSKEPVYVRR